MTTIAVDDRAAELIKELQDRAKARRVTFEAYLSQLASVERLAHPLSTPKQLVPFRDLLGRLASGAEAPARSLPADFSRADIYFDHD